jgi:hypothetical protein
LIEPEREAVRKGANQMMEKSQEFLEEDQNIKITITVRKNILNSADILGMIRSKDGDLLDWMYSTLPPQTYSVEVLPAGEPNLKGGSSSCRKKRRKMPKPIEYWKLE